ncbi:MAG: GNAT family N-acetyltransferase [Xenococcaceae cyanobacterium MO_188.B19]|nr:GNAT family N-acetyltransferase [Xenococcaceae cyanobacterium MO_188.B19]
MKFEIDTADALKLKDIEISELLNQVYVEGGFIDLREAALLLNPSAVTKRGTLIGVREKLYSNLVAMIILVPPDSAARRLAKNNEAEIHLLAVKPEYRRRGLGGMLVESAINKAKSLGCSKIILWTQTTMKEAQKLYQTSGFVYIDDIERNSRKFKVYELKLDS